jgi:hypothetical protein
MIDMNQFLRGYIDAALWSTTDTRDEESEPYTLDDEFDGVSNICRIAMLSDCCDFALANYHPLLAFKERTGRDDSDLGHDFWLTRAGHGAGYWDRGAGALGESLSAAARVYSTFEIYGDFEKGVVCSHHYG